MPIYDYLLKARFKNKIGIKASIPFRIRSVNPELSDEEAIEMLKKKLPDVVDPMITKKERTYFKTDDELKIEYEKKGGSENGKISQDECYN